VRATGHNAPRQVTTHREGPADGKSEQRNRGKPRAVSSKTPISFDRSERPCCYVHMAIYVARRKTLMKEGIRPERLKRFQRINRGIYAEQSATDTDPEDDDSDWRAKLQTRWIQSGTDSLVGLRSAARLHQLDGFATNAAIDTIVANAHHARTKGVHRSRTLRPEDVRYVDGFPVTSIARTLLDLGRVARTNELEFAVESALRGSNPAKPHVWNQELLADLWRRVERVHPNTGARGLRTVLMRRPPHCRPTGSYAETSFLQALRELGLGELGRQVDVRFISPNGEIVNCYVADFGFEERLFLVEVNGAASRGGATMTQADTLRMNRLARVFRVHVVSGADAVNPRKRRVAASEVRAMVEAEPIRTFPATIRGIRVHRTATGFDLFL
jgi:hypothetical protein